MGRVIGWVIISKVGNPVQQYGPYYDMGDWLRIEVNRRESNE